MPPDPDQDQERTHGTTANGSRTDSSDGNDGETASTDTVLTRRTALIGAGVGLGLLGGSNQSAAAPPGQRWKQDVDADGNDLLNLGGLNTATMEEETRIVDFAGSNLEIGDDSLNVSDRLDVADIELETVTATDTVSASTVNAEDVVRTSGLTGDVTGGERLRDLAGDNLSIVDDKLTATSRWRKRGVVLEPSDENVDGIEVEDVESSDSGDLNVEADDDLVLSISGGEGSLRIETEGGHEIVLDDSSESVSVTDSAGNSVEMDSTSGEVSVSATDKITLDAPTIELSAGLDVNIESKGVMNLETDGTASLKSAGVMAINGAITTLNGGLNPAARKGDSVDTENGIIEAGSDSVLIG